jgi:twitching motility protein PilT
MAAQKLIDLILYAAKKGSSDLHVSVGLKPRIRVDSQLVDTEFAELTKQDLEDFINEIIPKDRYEDFKKTKELDFSFGHPEIGRFRVNMFYQRSTIAMAIRILPNKIYSFDDLGLPPDLIQDLASAPTGLVLVTGSTGSGKTTTLASIIDFISKTRACHIVTVEDPIEFVFKHQKATVHQREIGSDSLSFDKSLRHVLRQDPDVILIGEMRDLETIETALTVAETGHLVFATLHTSDAVQTVNRVIDVFPEHQQRQVRTQLSFVLNATLSQRLIPLASGKGRILASEILIATSAVRSMIREEKVHQIYSSIQTGMRDGMKTLNQSLFDLFKQKKITIEDALANTTNTEELCRLIGITGKKR